MPAALAAHEDLAGAPIDVLELHCRDLDAAQTQAHQQQHDRLIATADRPPPITAGQ